jgi:glycosyltransferase involved in cell wall biosynthesis
VGREIEVVRIGLYSPFWASTFGGGEVYLGTAAEALRDAWPEHTVEIVSPAPADRGRYERQLGLNLHDIGLRATNPEAGPGGARRRLARLPQLHRLRNLLVSAQAAPVSADYDLWISMVYVLPAFTRARRGVILCQFPYRLPAGVGPRAQAMRLTRRVLFGHEVADFAEVIAQSEYTRSWVRRLWHRDARVVNPPIDVPAQAPEWQAKERVILSVGRFFAGGHSKRHDVMARAFRDLVDRGHSGWELHLAGSLHRGPNDERYFAEVQRLAEGYPIHLHTDVPRAELENLYRRASIYWHAAGYGVDPETHPAALEHFGMTTVEAMGRGAVPVAFGRGGQPEIVDHGRNGYLWTETAELVTLTAALIDDPGLLRRTAEAARERSRDFSASVFRERIVDALRPHVEALAKPAGRA